MNIFHNKESKAQFCLSLYIAVILVMNLLGSKTFSILNFTFSAPIIIFPIISVIQDSITEVFGQQKSKQFLYFAIICSFLTSIILALTSIILPVNNPNDGSSFAIVFEQYVRILIGFLISFSISYLIDISIFEKLRKLTGGKYLLFRTNISNLISIPIDAFLFTFLAFYAISPQYSLEIVFGIALSCVGFKLLWSFVSSPFVNLLVYWLRREYITVIQLSK